MQRALSLLLAVLLGLAAALPAQQEKKEGAPPIPKVRAGDVAPDFTLQDQQGNNVSLSGFRGKKNVVLAFYVFAFTGG